MKCSLWLGQGWRKLDPKRRGLHHGCLASEVGCPLREGTGKPSFLDTGEPVLRKHLARVHSLSLCPLPPQLLLPAPLATSCPEPLTSLWHFASAHLPGPFLPLLSSVPDLCAPSPIAGTLRNLVERDLLVPKEPAVVGQSTGCWTFSILTTGVLVSPSSRPESTQLH